MTGLYTKIHWKTHEKDQFCDARVGLLTIAIVTFGNKHVYGLASSCYWHMSQHYDKMIGSYLIL